MQISKSKLIRISLCAKIENPTKSTSEIWEWPLSLLQDSFWPITQFTNYNSEYRQLFEKLQNCTTIYYFYSLVFICCITSSKQGFHLYIHLCLHLHLHFCFLFSVFIFILFLLLVFSMSFTFACFALVYVIGCIYLMWILFFLVWFGLVGFGVYIIGFQCAYSHE